MSTTLPLRPAALGVAVLLAAPAASAQIAVALCAAESSSTACAFLDPQTRLMQTGRFSRVDIINVTTAGGGTPTLQQLLAYDALMCWTNSTPASNTAWGDVLANYVDAGGGVVVTVYANSTTTAGRNIGGRWQSGYEVILDQSGNASGAGAVLENVLVPNHPVMANVTGITAGTIGSRPTGTALEVGATLLATWGGGKVLAAVGANPQRVDLGFFPANTSCSTVGWTTGGDLLMANALEFVGKGASYRSYGSGCAGSLGVPSLQASGGSRPVIGTTFQATLGNLPLGVGIVTIGFSNTMFGPLPLPFDLTPFGLTGCSLLADPFANQIVVGAGNSASWNLPVPNLTTILGLSFFNQGMSLDSAANPAGLTVSNGGQGRVGI